MGTPNDTISAQGGRPGPGKPDGPPRQAGEATGRNWALGPFVKVRDPVLKPNPDATFLCPGSGKTVKWEQQNVYNPADGEGRKNLAQAHPDIAARLARQLIAWHKTLPK